MKILEIAHSTLHEDPNKTKMYSRCLFLCRQFTCIAESHILWKGNEKRKGKLTLRWLSSTYIFYLIHESENCNEGKVWWIAKCLRERSANCIIIRKVVTHVFFQSNWIIVSSQFYICYQPIRNGFRDKSSNKNWGKECKKNSFEQPHYDKHVLPILSIKMGDVWKGFSCVPIFCTSLYFYSIFHVSSFNIKQRKINVDKDRSKSF